MNNRPKGLTKKNYAGAVTWHKEYAHWIYKIHGVEISVILYIDNGKTKFYDKQMASKYMPKFRSNLYELYVCDQPLGSVDEIRGEASKINRILKLARKAKNKHELLKAIDKEFDIIDEDFKDKIKHELLKAIDKEFDIIDEDFKDKI